ncbi:fatty acid-binding protein-like [Cydia fagiglandana]|uniref:fatty acid-binding protein-like n=1 Tax=Cydia fagiglandana TaxID=1458189 RepID=UPI002FEE6329
MEQFLGKKYKLVSSENFEEYLKFIQVGFLSRKAAQAACTVSFLERNADGSYTFSVTSPIKSSIITFREGEEFIENRLDGAKVKTTVTIEENKLIQKQVEDNGRITTNLREFTPEFLVVTTTAEGWDGKCVRTYKVIE